MATAWFSKYHLAVRRRCTCFRQVSEGLWFCLSLMLFIVLGPFCGPVVLMVLARLGMEEHTCQEPQSVTTL